MAGRHFGPEEGTTMADRPNPLGAAASKVGTAWSAAAGVVSALVAFGVLTAAEGDALTQAGNAAPTLITVLGAAIAGVMAIVSGVVAAFRTAEAAKDHVTPVGSPMVLGADGKLVPLIPADTGNGVPAVNTPSDVVMPAPGKDLP